MHNPSEPGRRGDGTWGHPSYTAIELGGGWGDQRIPNPRPVFWSLLLSLRAPRQPLAPCFDLILLEIQSSPSHQCTGRLHT